VRIWDPTTGQTVTTLIGHTDRIRALAWSPDGAHLASAGTDQTVRIWDPAIGHTVATVIGHTDRIRALAWSPGSLMGAVGLNGAAEDEGGNLRTAQIASNGWARWTPFNAAAIGAHLLGGAGVLLVNRRRVVGQRGVGASTVAKALLTAAALGATGYSRVLGKKIELASSPDPSDAEKADAVPIGIEQAQQQLRVAQWTIPLLTGAL
jgi:hypothetical protein